MENTPVALPLFFIGRELSPHWIEAPVGYHAVCQTWWPIQSVYIQLWRIPMGLFCDKIAHEAVWQ